MVALAVVGVDVCDGDRVTIDFVGGSEAGDVSVFITIRSKPVGRCVFKTTRRLSVGTGEAGTVSVPYEIPRPGNYSIHATIKKEGEILCKRAEHFTVARLHEEGYGRLVSK